MRSSCFSIHKGWKKHPIGSSYLFSSFIHFHIPALKRVKNGWFYHLRHVLVSKCTPFFVIEKCICKKKKLCIINLRSRGVRMLRRKWKLKGGSLIQQHISRNGFFKSTQCHNGIPLRNQPIKTVMQKGVILRVEYLW